MDHAEAHERIADLALEPRRLAALESSDEIEDVALRAHVDSCQRCRSDVAEWRHFQAATQVVLATNRLEQLEPIAPPVDLRDNVLAVARATPVHKTPPADIIVVHPRARGPRPLSRGGLLALAAVFALMAAGLGVVFVREQSAELARTQLHAMWLSDTVSAMSRVLATPDHHVVTLRTGDGTGAGAIAWSRHDLVVLASGLPEPASGQVYLCWLQYDGTETAMGKMWFVDGDSFWVSSTDDWAAIELDPEKQFLVTLESTANLSARHVGPVVLQANLGG